MKLCRGCDETKPLTEFSLSRQAKGNQKAVYRSQCKVCQSERAKVWFANNKERTQVTKRRFNLMKNYGLTVEQYDTMLTAQGGVCAICGESDNKEHGATGTKFSLAVDHDHSTGRIRGLLCNNCNRAIGLLKDNVDLLREAANYLER